MFEFKDDRIFLLSIEEYKNYKDHIPQIYCWWWLRSPGSGPNFTAFVFIDDSVLHSGDLVSNDRGAIRPALYYDNISLEKEEKFIYCGITWVVLDRNLAIAEVPITFKRFDGYYNCGLLIQLPQDDSHIASYLGYFVYDLFPSFFQISYIQLRYPCPQEPYQ